MIASLQSRTKQGEGVFWSVVHREYLEKLGTISEMLRLIIVIFQGIELPFQKLVYPFCKNILTSVS
jgi:hypothetical protein